MKKLLKKIAAIMMTAAISVSAMAVSTVSAGAAGVFDDAIEMDELEMHSISTGDEDSLKQDYEITIKKAGTIKVFALDYCSVSAWDYATWQLLDSKSNPISDNDLVNDMSEYKDLKAGTYYLRIKLTKKDHYVNNFYYAFEPTEKPQLSFKITLKKGGKVQLGSVVENYDGAVTWLSTKKSVATVSKTGLVTAKKAGKTTIRASLDSGEFVEITVVVSKK